MKPWISEIAAWVGLFLALSIQLGCESSTPSAPSRGTSDGGQAPIEQSDSDTDGISRPSDSGSPGSSRDAEPTPVPRGELRELTWSYPSSQTKVGPLSVVVAIPTEASETNRMPVLIALHGMGEAMKQPDDGARGWIDDYWLPQAVRRLSDPPLTDDDFLSFVTEERLEKINRGLKAQPFGGVIVVTPFTPRVIQSDRSGRALRHFGAFLVDELIPRVYRETPALGAPASTGIDGVSFGGRIALVLGLRHSKAFGAVATVQAGCLPTEAPGLAGMAAEARRANPLLKIRLLTSHRDGFLRANHAISDAFDRAGLEHQFLELPGPHNYDFNRGPGVLEMLLFHDRVLRGLEPL